MTSKPGTGSCFHFTLPGFIRNRHEYSDHRDNSDNFYLEQYLLQAHSHRVTGTTDGASGIALAQTLAFDVILLDINCRIWMATRSPAVC